MTEHVRAWSETLEIPTYPVGQPLKQPLFLNRRVYQGSSGVVYPYPVIDSVGDTAEPRAYTAVFLENRYLKILILPELGGRVQMALDKTNDYHFVYYNRVIKPALVGLAGPWISGGIEFNWPQHHRPSTFDAVDWRIVNNDDGSVTVWCSEVERMFFTKGMHGFTLHPDRAVLHIDVQLHNRTDTPQTFLWWANPAVHVNDDYQSVFPPDVRAVMDHGKRDVSEFPIARGTYYKVNYAPGTDISRYKNIPVPTSYMAHHSDFDFIGNYDHGRQAGMMHVANHHLVPGKKQWTWGNSDFGQMWDRQLTDEDGPYIELMCGAFTDNQPDFAWLMPGEEKRFQQNFFPYKDIGPASNANTEAVVHLHLAHDTAHIGVYVTTPSDCRAVLLYRGNLLWQRERPLSPTSTLVEAVPVPADTKEHELTLVVYERAQHRELIRFAPLKPEVVEMPVAATPAAAPRDIPSNDQLFLNGLHLEQYRHVTYRPDDYYLEAIRRDPHDSRCNNAMGLLVLRRGDFQAAEHFFRRAISRLTERNPNPYDGEAYYNLGQSLRYQGRLDEAFTAFYKAVWNAAWQDASFFELARIAARQGRLAEALDLAQQALRRNWSHQRARLLEISLLRRLGRPAAAHAACVTALTLDAMEPGAAWELAHLGGDRHVFAALTWDAHLCETLAHDYVASGDTDMALRLCAHVATPTPLTAYLQASIHTLRDDQAAVAQALQQAQQLPLDWCFPHRLEHVVVLRQALSHQPHDGVAAYLLGNFWYAHKMPDSAIEYWQHSLIHAPHNAVAWRNVGLALVNHYADTRQGLEAYQRARHLDPHDARLLYEYDQLQRLIGTPIATRRAVLEQTPELLAQRDDLTCEYAAMLNMQTHHQQALDVLMARNFHPWEGGEGRVASQYVAALIGLAQAALQSQQVTTAITHLERALHYPVNLGEGKLPGSNENHIRYYLGCAWHRAGDQQRAHHEWHLATRGDGQPSSAQYYNDQPPDLLLYQGLAWLALGETTKAHELCTRLVHYATQHRDQTPAPDYFAVSLPTFLVFDDNPQQRHRIHCDYVAALGHIGLGQWDEARTLLQGILAVEPSHQGSVVHLRFCETAQGGFPHAH